MLGNCLGDFESLLDSCREGFSRSKNVYEAYQPPILRVLTLMNTTVCSFQYSGVFATFVLVFVDFFVCLLLVYFCFVLFGFLCCC